LKETDSQESILNLVFQLLDHVSRKRLYQFVLLLGLTLVSSAAEVISLSAVVPFIGILTAPEQVFNNSFAVYLLSFVNLTPEDNLVLSFSVFFVIAAILAGVLRLLLLWGSIRLVTATGIDLSLSVYKKTLFQPYPVHVSRSSSEIISGITLKVGSSTGVLIAIVNIITSLLLFTAILATLLIIDPLIATMAVVFFGFIYLSIASMTRKKLRSNSGIINSEQSNVVKALQEGLGSIRDVLLDGTQAVYCSVFGQAINKLEKANRQNKFINQAPRYLIESLAMVLIALLTYLLSVQEGGLSASLPVLAALALGAQRILPLSQQLYTNWSTANGSHAVLKNVLELLNQPLPDISISTDRTPLKFEQFIKLEKVSFHYAESQNLVLDTISLEIPKGSRTGIVGATGSGKSTMMDLLMGLLEPVDGELLIDDISITKSNREMWQKNIAHVPQNIFLSDATIAENIALGVPVEEIDHERVKDAARQARIDEFIESKKEKYQSFVGERGVRLSGGQRQRIGIARALFKKATVLVFDEATSALDNDTELEVMRAIEKLDRKLTIIIIAHRVSTLQNCESIVKLKNGKIVENDTYSNFNKNN
jgi:ATP-binding cassette, subfamily B, bacterial PglK